MWKGRFKERTSSLLQEYSESVSFDWRLYKQDIRGSIAHARALEKAGILTLPEYEQIAAGLREIGAEIEAGDFEFDTELEDIHMNIEAALTRRIGPVGGKLHTARSRNDQVSLDFRLYLRDACQNTSKRVARLQSALVALADRNRGILIPGYTHLQRAQPVPVAHHLLAYVEMLQRDVTRLRDCRHRLNELPLGSGAIAGSSVVLDRGFLAELLDFPRITQNSMDAVADRDFVCELASVIAIAGMHLSRLSEDVILWATTEFGFIRLSDAHTTGSSLMPQKKNPDVAELARGKTGRLYGNLMQVLTVLKGLPMTYNRDLQEDKEAVFDSIDTIDASLEILAEMMEAAEWNAEASEKAMQDPMLLATDVADYLVRKQVPFREAHEIVGKLVARSVEIGKPLDQLPFEVYRTISEAFEEDIFGLYDPRKAVDARTAEGATSASFVGERIRHWQELLEETT